MRNIIHLPSLLKRNTTILLYCISLLCFLQLTTIAQILDANVPTGFAIVNADGLETTTGGGNGQVVTAKTYSDLSTYCGSSNALIIIVEGTISGSTSISLKSNKTIIGKGITAQLSGFGLSMNTVSNIIIRNLKISGSVDGIAARNTHHLWIDHCEIWDCADGLLDITIKSSYATVSWCKFYYINQVDHRLACLIGAGGGTQPDDWGRNKVTYHHNWYDKKVDQRMPRLMYGQGHVFNDYYSCSGNTYCISVGSYGAALVENNYFKGVKNPHQFQYDVYCHITANGNTYDNTTGLKDAGLGGTRKEVGQDFNVVAFTAAPYMYTLNKAIDIPSLVSGSSSVNNGYGEIGLMPTPGQGAIKLPTTQILKWAKGTLGNTATSYKVYLGTVSNPPLVATVSEQSYTPSSLLTGTIYYWRVDAVTPTGIVEGKLWQFKTDGNPPNNVTFDCAGTENGTAKLDNCDRCTGATTGKVLCTSFGEAETEACAYDGVLESSNSGFKGTSYINLSNSVGSSIAFNISATNAGSATLSFRYANGGNADRPSQVSVNNTILANNLNFPITGDFATWKTVDLTVSLVKGINTVKLISTTSDGLSNIDQIGYVSTGLSKGNCVVSNITDISSSLDQSEIYPNPFSNEGLYINTNAQSNYKIKNMQGTIVEEGTFLINAHIGKSLNIGLYVLELEYESKNYSIKISKK